MEEYIIGTAVGVIKGDTRSFDYSSWEIKNARPCIHVP